MDIEDFNLMIWWYNVKSRIYIQKIKNIILKYDLKAWITE